MLASPLALADEPKRGGEVTILYKDDFNSMDPAIGYTVQSWAPIKAVFDGLMDYKPGTSELVPDLAESFEISPDGKTYTFKLRKGVKFHNGRELKAADIKYSIERVCSAKTQSPGASFFTSVIGCQDLLDGEGHGDVGHHHAGRLYRGVPAERAERHHAARLRAQLLLRRAEGSGGGISARISPITRSAPAPTRWRTTRPASTSSWSAIPTGTRMAGPMSTRSRCNSASSRRSACCACRRTKPISWARSSRRPSSLEVSQDASLKDRFVTASQLNTNYMTMNYEHQAVRRRARAPRRQHGGQQAAAGAGAEQSRHRDGPGPAAGHGRLRSRSIRAIPMIPPRPRHC